MGKVTKHSPGMISGDASRAGDDSARDDTYLRETELYKTMVEKLGQDSADQLIRSSEPEG